MACSSSLNQKRKLDISRNDQPLDSAFAGSSASICFPGARAMLNFGAVNGLNRQGNSLIHSFDPEETGYDCFDEYLAQPEKKRRLSVDQVRFLEKCFVADNRLEPERKIQLAKELNLQPRQVAIWFQNRRARWRNKQLETDYETLHASFVNLKNEYDKLVKENEKLKSEVLLSKHDGPANEIEKSSDLYVFSAEELTKQAVTAIVYCETEEFKELALVKSDVSDVESPRIIDGIHLFHSESGDSSRFFELEQSDMSQNGEDELKDELLETFDNSSKTEDGFCEESKNSFYYGLQVEDHSLNFWPY